MTHICVSKIIGSDNGLSPGRRQAIIWTNAGILLIRTFGTNFSEILSAIHAFSFKKMHLKMSSAKWRPFCLGLNVLKYWLVACSAPNHYLNQCWIIVDKTHRNKFQWFLNQINNFSFKQNLLYIDGLEQDCCNSIATILELLQSCINSVRLSDAYMRQ